MRIGLRLPGAGKFAGPETISTVARLAERIGFDSLWMTEHVALPTKIESRYPYRDDGKFLWAPDTPYLEILLSLAWAGAATEKITLGTSMLILPWHPLIPTAKGLVTLDVLIGGRLTVGIAVGWMKEQFELLGVEFDKRGPRTTEAIRAMRHMWAAAEVDFHGEFYDLSGFMMYPKPVRPEGIPIWLGGAAKPVLRRVAEVGDGWQPVAVNPDEFAELKTILGEYLEAEGRTFDDITLSVRPLWKMPMNGDTLNAYAELGVTELVCDTSFGHETLGEALEEIEALGEKLIPIARTL